MTAGRKLAIGGAVVVSVTAFMAYVGGATSWQYYLTVDECLSDIDRQAGAAVRVSGRVAAGSLRIVAAPGKARFSLVNPNEAGDSLPVNFAGQLPDNMAEQIDVIVDGRLEATGVLRGEKVLTRCASKYEAIQPPVADGSDSQPDAGEAR